MKVLRLFRNIAVLFILLVALLVSRPGVGTSHATEKFICVYPGKTGFNCNFDSSGNCFETKCEAGQPCSNGSCTAPPKPPKCFFCKGF
jgi:hypothetical protein